MAKATIFSTGHSTGQYFLKNFFTISTFALLIIIAIINPANSSLARSKMKFSNLKESEVQNSYNNGYTYRCKKKILIEKFGKLFLKIIFKFIVKILFFSIIHSSTL